MNSNALILLGALLGLFIGFPLGVKALRSRASRRKKVYIGMTLALLSCSLLGGISVGWSMRHPQSYTLEPTPLSVQSQVIAHEWSEQDPHGSRFSLSGRDGTEHWRSQDQCIQPGSGLFALANGTLYQRGVIPEQQEICIRASRLSDGTELWSRTIKSSQSPENLHSSSLRRDHILAAHGKLYLQIDEMFYELDARDGKILNIIKPGISGHDDAVFSDFATNDEVLVLTYSIMSDVYDDKNGALQDIFVVLHISDGNVLWKSSRRAYQQLIALQGNTLYTQQNGVLVALRVRDGSALWQSDLPGGGIVTSSASRDRVYVRAQNAAGSSKACVYALDAQNGHILWKIPVGTWSGEAPVEANGVTYIADTNSFSALEASTGHLLWQYKQEPFSSTAIAFNPYDVISFSQPVVVDGVVFVSNTFAPSFPPPLRLLPNFCLGQCRPIIGIFALRASDGKLYWYHQIRAQVELLAAYES